MYYDIDFSNTVSETLADSLRSLTDKSIKYLDTTYYFGKFIDYVVEVLWILHPIGLQ